MIEKEVFAQRMGLLAGRIGRELEAPVFREYYTQLSAMLTTQQFVAATALAFHTWSAEYRNWPSPKQLVELIAPVAQPELSAGEAYERVLSIAGRYVHDPAFATRMADIQRLGANTLRAFRAAGGFRDFSNPLESELPWLRKRFVEVYEATCAHAESEQAAQLALASADTQVAELSAATAAKLAMPNAKQGAKQIAAGGAR